VSEKKTQQLKISLQTSRLSLKDLTIADAAALFQYRSLPEVTRFQGFSPASEEEAVRFIEEDICHVFGQPDTWFQLGIFLREEKTLVGDLGIHFLPGESTVEIGVTVAPRFQGRGIANEAVVCVVNFLFDTLHKSKVTASVDPENQKSMALMNGIGFRLEGIYEKAVLFRGEWADDAVYEMTAEEWQKRTKHNL